MVKPDRSTKRAGGSCCSSEAGDVSDGARWWAVQVQCAPSLRERAFGRLRQLGLRGCLVEQPAGSPLRLRGYLSVRPTSRRALMQFAFALEQDATRGGLPIPAIAFRKVDTCAMDGAWKPLRVGRRIVVQLEHEPVPATDDLVIRLTPRFAFGQGHPTTRHCLEALERRFEEPNVALRVADVGCGTGVLAIAALLLGARRVYAVDVDPVAIDAARANHAVNDLDDRLEIETGSLGRLQAMVNEPVDGLLCNINTSVDILEELISGFATVTRPESWAIVSGITEPQKARVGELIAQHGWAVEGWREEEGWCTAEAQRTVSSACQ